MIDFLTKVFFEDWLLLGVAEAVALGVVVAMHRRRLTSASRRAVWITLAVCVGLFVMQRLVVTDRESLRELVRTMVRAVDEGDISGIGTCVDEEGIELGSGTNALATAKAVFLQSATVGLQQYHVDEAGAGGFKFDISGDSAVVTFQATCDIRGQREAPQRLPSMWRIRCVRRGDGWRMNGIIEARIGLAGLGNPIDIMSYLREFRATALQATGR